MGRFFGQMGLFSIGLIVLNGALFLWSEELLFRDYATGFRRLDEGSYVAIVLGDSRTADVGEMSSFKRTLNFSFDADCLTDMLIKLSYALAIQRELTTVLVSADDYHLNERRLTMNNRSRSVRFSDRESYGVAYGTSGQFLWEKYATYYVPMFAVDRAALVQRRLHSSVRRWVSYGLGRSDPPISGDADDADWSSLSAADRRREAGDRVDTLYRGGSDAQLEFVLRELVRMTREYKIRLVGVKFPLTVEYRELEKARAERLPSEILLDEGVQVVDYSRLYDRSPEFFKDSDHLNRRGVEEFQKKLSALIDTQSKPLGGVMGQN